MIHYYLVKNFLYYVYTSGIILIPVSWNLLNKPCVQPLSDVFTTVLVGVQRGF